MVLNLSDPISAEHRQLIQLCLYAERQWMVPQLTDGDFYRNRFEPVIKEIDRISPAIEAARTWGDIPRETLERVNRSVDRAAGTLGLLPGVRGMNGYEKIFVSTSDQLVPLYTLLCDLLARTAPRRSNSRSA